MPPRRPHWFPGGPPGDEPLGGPTGKSGLFNPISRVPNWMRSALGLTRDEIPNRLRTDQVIPAIEFGQQGWGFVDYIPVRLVLVSAGAGVLQFIDSLPVSGVFLRRLLYIEAESTAAVARTMQLVLRVPALGLAPAVLDINVTETGVPPAPDVATTADITQGVAVTIPPGARIGFDSGLSAAETSTLEMLWAQYPVGYPLSGF